MTYPERKPDDWRAVYAFPWRRSGGPRKIVIDVYEDGYTPVDVMGALTCFTLENPDIVERFRAYIDDEDAPEIFTGAEAEAHLRVMLKLLITLWETPESSSVYVTGSKGWVN